ncbi:class I SAM-dependent rRNA methyltransferase [Atopobacter phocae]|uniref:class I SAM-dependent rRNA methyltransferase n=1 Tax=Atopobacter phocae TaxID=136492 RepID=UPI000471979B|nr:class I SAM-dependent rRNA methyltransferase [Atopobacter phocae]
MKLRQIKLRRPFPSASKPLIKEEQVISGELTDNGEIVELVDTHGNYVGSALLAQQNKGIGWWLTKNRVDDFPSYLQTHLAQAIQARQHYFADHLTTAFRLVNGEGDHLPSLTIDWYDHYLVVSLYSKSIAAYERMLCNQLNELLDIKGIVVKRRYEDLQSLSSEWVFGQEAPEPLIILENGVKYATYLNDGWMTGIFLDQREVRQQIMEHYAMGKEVLNLFSYTGAFSVSAAMGGALRTTSVDAANRSRELTEEQFAVNGLNPADQSIYVFDVFKFFNYARNKGMTFDLIISDPPSFARTKKRVFNVIKDYPEIIRQSVSLLNPNGYLIVSTNASNWSSRQFDYMIEETLSQLTTAFEVVESFELPADFKTPEDSTTSKYLKVRVIQISDKL